jgi:hypothetical protein
MQQTSLIEGHSAHHNALTKTGEPRCRWSACPISEWRETVADRMTVRSLCLCTMERSCTAFLLLVLLCLPPVQLYMLSE